ncbi:hypothetical protein D3C72_2556930 [compost metagenome]
MDALALREQGQRFEPVGGFEGLMPHVGEDGEQELTIEGFVLDDQKVKNRGSS